MPLSLESKSSIKKNGIINQGFVLLLQLWAFPMEYSDNSISFIQANSFIFMVKWKIQDEM